MRGDAHRPPKVEGEREAVRLIAAPCGQISVTPERARARVSLFPSLSFGSDTGIVQSPARTSLRTWHADKSAGELGGARDERAIRPNVCRPSGNSLVPKIALSAIDSRDRYSAAVRWNRRGVPKAARSEIPSRRQGDRKEESSGRSGTGRERERAERLYCSSTGPRLVSVITDRSLRGSPLMPAHRSARVPRIKGIRIGTPRGDRS